MGEKRWNAYNNRKEIMMTEERANEMDKEIGVEENRLRKLFTVAMRLTTYTALFPDEIRPPMRIKREGEWRCPECKELIKIEVLVEYGWPYNYSICDCGWEYADQIGGSERRLL